MIVTKSKFLEIKSNLNRPTPVTILTGSMSPFIKPGDQVWIRPFDPNTLKKFDTIVFWSEDKLICHFFYKKEKIEGNWFYFAKALNSKRLDHPFAEDEILGIAIRPTLPKWKKFFMKMIF
ncbi:MAG: S24/S26 family peptidase [Bacteriovoracaceae bacterium]|nr:S24/S26 family peptidase [Bacteriovoracaceae bacterium]